MHTLSYVDSNHVKQLTQWSIIMIFRFKTSSGKRFGGPLYDTADDIFGDVQEAVANLNGGGGEPAAEPVTDPNTQDVDPTKGQGTEEKEGTPETPVKSADDSTKEPEGDKEGKKKVDGVAEVREWGKGWEKTAGDYKKTIEGYEPVVKFVDEKFGGQSNLELAAEVYGAIANEDEFDAANAVEFLSENLPGVADKLVTYIAQNVAERASSTAIERTFGRKLNEQDIKDVQAFLATGKQKDSNKFDSILNADSIPDELKFDSDGNERDPQVLDYLWKQQQALNAAQAQLKNLEGRVNGADDERKQQVAAEAIESYVTENFKGISDKISELGLDKPVEGETEEIGKLRTEYAGFIDAIVLHKASQDATFQTMYRNALAAVAKATANPKDRAAKAKQVDYSRRISARINEFAAEAAELISPLIESFATKRGAQIEKINKTKPEPTTPGAPKETTKERDPNKDPFDSEDIQNEVADIMRARQAQRR